VLSLVRIVDGRPLRCSSSRSVLPSENILCQRKAYALDIASSPNACWSFPCVVVPLSLSLTHTKKKMVYRCAISCVSISATRFSNTSWHVRHLLHNELLQSHATANGDRGRDQGQRLSVLAGCSMASTARRKLVSLLYCRTTY
jgi:hypothetical protein